jgi:hypothetical protein
VALSGPKEISDWQPGDPIPPGYHTQTRVRKGLIIGGAIPFGVLYLLSAFSAAVAQDASQGSTNSNPAGALYIPAVGPFIQMGNTSSSIGNFFLAVDGAGQTAGLIMLVYGLTVPSTILVRNDLGAGRPLIVPMRMGRDGTGVGLRVAF